MKISEEEIQRMTQLAHSDRTAHNMYSKDVPKLLAEREELRTQLEAANAHVSAMLKVANEELPFLAWDWTDSVLSHSTTRPITKIRFSILSIKKLRDAFKETK